MNLGSITITEIDKSASYLSHGGPWKEHKYIKKIGGRYYYEEKTKNGIIDHNLNNLEGVSLFGDKEARKDYIHAKQDIKDLNKTLKAVNKDLKKAIKSNDQKCIDKYTSSKSTIEKASTYASKNLDKKKDAYNKTRTLDDIPAYLISQGEHKIISILNSLKKNDSYLAHHGILGMKWGIRRFQNPDGTLTDAGKKRYGKEITKQQEDKIYNVLKNKSYKEDVSDKIFTILGANKDAIKEANKILKANEDAQAEITKKEQSAFKELYENDNTRRHYEAVSEIASYKDFGSVKDMTLEDVGSFAYHGIFGDGQQSKINAYSLYLYDHPELDKNNAIRMLVNKSEELKSSSFTKARDVLQKALNDAGCGTLKANENTKLPLSYILALDIQSKYDTWEKTSGSWYLSNMVGPRFSFNNDDKTAIADAKQIVSKIKNNTDKNTWYLLNEAVENLGLSNEKASELSQSDWDKINAEVAKLKKTFDGEYI